MARVEEQLTEQNELARRKVEAAEERNKRTGKEKKVKTTPDTKAGLICYEVGSGQIEEAKNINAQIDKRKAAKKENDHRAKMRRHYEAVVECEKRVKGTGRPPTTEHYQATLKAAYQVDKKTEQEITNDIYGEKKKNTFKNAADVKGVWDAHVKRLGGNDNIQWEMLKAEYYIAEDKIHSCIIDTEEGESPKAQKRKHGDIAASDGNVSHENIDESKDDTQSPKRSKSIVEDEDSPLRDIMEVDP